MYHMIPKAKRNKNGPIFCGKCVIHVHLYQMESNGSETHFGTELLILKKFSDMNIKYAQTNPVWMRGKHTCTLFERKQLCYTSGQHAHNYLTTVGIKPTTILMVSPKQ